ncbi:MAG: 3',5'-cyclic-nucleotide phosphodiesterase [Pseudomonadota bacterium]
MRLRVLGCSGGIGRNLRTTSLLIDDDILIDCGTGVGDLSIEEMKKIRHIFLTHSHLDHLACLPLMVDTLYCQLQQQPLWLHALPDTFEVLAKHIFNWKVWPDFFMLPDPANAVIRYSPFSPGETLEIEDRTVAMVKVNHVVPGVAYRIADSHSAMAFSGDTTTNDAFWQLLNAYDRLDLLVIECAFPNRDQALSKRAKHYCPTLLAEDMAKLKHHPKTCITHLKPGEEALIFEQVNKALPQTDLLRLVGGEVFELPPRSCK